MAITLAVDTYITVADAIQYAADEQLEIPTDEETLEPLLKRATRALDRKYANLYLGYKSLPEQPLQWPRLVTNVLAYKGEVYNMTMDSDGNPRNFNGLQSEVAQATVELAALLFAENKAIYEQPQPALKSTHSKLDVLETSEEYANPVGHVVDPMFKIKMILRPLLRSTTGLTMSRGR